MHSFIVLCWHNLKMMFFDVSWEGSVRPMSNMLVPNLVGFKIF